MNVGAHRHTGLGNELNTIFSHGSHRRRVDNLRVDTRLYSFEHIASGKVNSRSLFKGKVDVGFRSRHQRMHHALHVSTGHIVSFKVVARNILQSGLVCLNQAGHNYSGRHITNAHQKQLHQRNLYTRHLGREPKKERYKMKEHGQ